MTTSVIRAGGTGVAGVQTTGGDDGALSLKVGPLSTTVEALSITSAGAATLASTLAITGDLTANNFAGRNKIINGAMVIDQRNAGAVISSLGAAKTYIVDRFFYQSGNAGRFSAQQNAAAVTPPEGYIKYLGFTSLGANTPADSDYGIASQIIEGFNTADLGWGTASAATITISFWVRSSITGTQSIAVVNLAGNRSYSQTYTISSANTWEQKTITITGDTTGTWPTDHTNGIMLRFALGTGANNLTSAGAWRASNSNGATGTAAISATSGATFYITGVQLEKSSTATEFEYRPYGTELALCQRYLPAFSNVGNTTGNGQFPALGNGLTTTTGFLQVPFPVPARINPTGVTVSAVAHFQTGVAGATTDIVLSAIGFNQATKDACLITFTQGSATAIVDKPIGLRTNSTDAKMYFTGAEL